MYHFIRISFVCPGFAFDFLLSAFDLAGQMALLYIMPLYVHWSSSSNDDGCSRRPFCSARGFP